MPRQRVPLAGRQYAALAVLLVLIGAVVSLQLAGAPLWPVAVALVLQVVVLVGCAVLVVIPLLRPRGR